MSITLESNFSHHAIKRSQQRGIRPWVVNFILEYADKYKHANESCISQFISKRRVKKTHSGKCFVTSEGSANRRRGRDC